MNNPFYVQPASFSGIMDGMQGFKNNYDQKVAQDEAMAKELQAKQENDAIMKEGALLIQSGDPAAIADWAFRNPNHRDQFIKAADIQDNLTTKSRLKTARDVLSGVVSPSEAYQERYNEIVSNGGSAPELKKDIENPDPEAIKKMALEDLAMLDPAGFKSYMEAQGSSGTGSPSSVRETEWFLKQTPEIQEKHIALKRKTDPTLAEKLQYEADKSGIKVNEAVSTTTGKGNASRKQGFIDSGIEAADSLGNIARSISLLDEVATGGFSNAALKAKRLFGIESADEAELSAGMGKAILSQLKPIFGAAFTAAEGERLERIEANFGKSTEGNKRLLKQVKAITERAAKRGLKAAKDQGDEFTASEIQAAMDKMGMDEPVEDEAPKYEGANLDAYNWAKSNPNDPRAAAILKKLGAN